MKTVSIAAQYQAALSLISDTRQHLHCHSALVELFRTLLHHYFNSAGKTALSIITMWLLVYLVTHIYTRFNHLFSIPGPTYAAYSRFWLSKAYSTGHLHQIYHEASTRYGPLIRIGPNHILLSDPGESMRILCSRSRYERGPWYDAFKIEPDRPNIVSQRHRPSHLRMRFQMASGVQSRVSSHSIQLTLPSTAAKTSVTSKALWIPVFWIL